MFNNNPNLPDQPTKVYGGVVHRQRLPVDDAFVKEHEGAFRFIAHAHGCGTIDALLALRNKACQLPDITLKTGAAFAAMSGSVPAVDWPEVRDVLALVQARTVKFVEWLRDQGARGSGTQEEEIIIVPGRWDLPFRHTAGRVASHFFHALKEKRILALRCPRCQRVLIPPRPFCERCFVPLNDWVEVGQQGTLEAFTVCYARFTGLPDPPYCLILVKPDGADTALNHLLGEVELDDVERMKEAVRIGMRLEAVWRQEREGGIQDIEYWRPVP